MRKEGVAGLFRHPSADRLWTFILCHSVQPFMPHCLLFLYFSCISLAFSPPAQSILSISCLQPIITSVSSSCCSLQLRLRLPLLPTSPWLLCQHSSGLPSLLPSPHCLASSTTKSHCEQKAGKHALFLFLCPDLLLPFLAEDRTFWFLCLLLGWRDRGMGGGG